MTDWSIFGGDPAPGSPEVFEGAAQAFGPIVDAGQSSLDSLRAITQQAGSTAWLGNAAETFAKSVQMLPTDIGDLVEAHQTAVAALSDYSDTLRSLQAQASDALAQAQTAASEAESASTRCDNDSARIRDADEQYSFFQEKIDVLELEKNSAGLLGDQALVATLEAEIASATQARDAASAERSAASTDLRVAQSALSDARDRVAAEQATGKRIAADRFDAANHLMGRLQAAGEFGVGHRSWFDRVRDTFDSVAKFSWRHVEESLAGASHAVVAAAGDLDTFARAHAESVRSAADVVNRYADDVSKTASRVAPAFAAAALMVESASAVLPPPADAALFAVGDQIAAAPSRVAAVADGAGLLSAGIAVTTDELAEVPASQRTAQFEVDKKELEGSTTSLAVDGLNSLVGQVLPPIDGVPAMLAQGGATDTVRAVANYGAQTYVIPDAESAVQSKVTGP